MAGCARERQRQGHRPRAGTNDGVPHAGGDQLRHERPERRRGRDVAGHGSEPARAPTARLCSFMRRFRPFAVGLRVAHDAAAHEQAAPASPVDDARPDGDHELAVAASVEPADRARVPAAVEMLLLLEQLQGRGTRPATDRRGRMQPVDEVEDAQVVAQLARRRRWRGAGASAAGRCGASGRCRAVQPAGARVSRSMSTTTACSSRSFSEASSVVASSPSVDRIGVPAGRAGEGDGPEERPRHRPRGAPARRPGTSVRHGANANTVTGAPWADSVAGGAAASRRRTASVSMGAGAREVHPPGEHHLVDRPRPTAPDDRATDERPCRRGPDARRPAGAPGWRRSAPTGRRLERRR